MALSEVIKWKTSNKIKKALYILALGNPRAFFMNWYASLLFVLFSFMAFAQEASYEKQVDSLFEKAYEHLYINKDSAYHYFQKIEGLAVENKDWAIVFETLITSNRHAGSFYDLDKISDNLNRLDSLFNEHKEYLDSLPEKQLFINSVLYDKGNYYFQLNDYRSSRQIFGQIIDALETIARFGYG